MHSSKVQSSEAVRRRESRSWILTPCLSLSTVLSSRFHFSSHSNTHLKSITVERYMRALQFWIQRPFYPDWLIFPGGLQVFLWNRPCIAASWLHCVFLSWSTDIFVCQCTLSMSICMPVYSIHEITRRPFHRRHLCRRKYISDWFQWIKTFQLSACGRSKSPGMVTRFPAVVVITQIIWLKIITRPNLRPHSFLLNGERPSLWGVKTQGVNFTISVGESPKKSSHAEHNRICWNNIKMNLRQ
jgi:hypothetical protein